MSRFYYEPNMRTISHAPLFIDVDLKENSIHGKPLVVDAVRYAVSYSVRDRLDTYPAEVARVDYPIEAQKIVDALNAKHEEAKNVRKKSYAEA